jgi:PAS domain S-box-containing protein
MAAPRQRSSRDRSTGDAPALILIGVTWLAVLALVSSTSGIPRGVVATISFAAALGATLFINRWAERRRWSRPLHHLSMQLATLAEDPSQPLELTTAPELAELSRALSELRTSWLEASRLGASAAFFREMISAGRGASNPQQKLNTTMTRSGMMAAMPVIGAEGYDPNLSGDFSTTDMVNRLEPRTLRWIESSPPEQEFLGWDLTALREKSFLEIVHPEDRPRVKEQVGAALEKGEVHGLILRIKTAQGTPKAIEINIGVRYGPDRAVSHLRCHLTDVTDKIRADRELRLRTRELTQVNEQLRQINRELEELKDRYRDLYQNAPAMYYSLEPDGRVLDCNETLLQTLGYPRGVLVGEPFTKILAEPYRSNFAGKSAELRRQGSVEMESQWIKANGEVIDVWISAKAVRGLDGKFLHTRSVAQDVTARLRLEAELKEKNERLARTNEELSRKNREMDEFAYVVSHDLQEPLRTLVAFSDFLLKDYGDRLDANGQEYVRYLVEASRRMRALIHGLLHLSRAGKVTGELGPVNLEERLAVVKADLGELVRTRGAEIRTSGPLPIVWGDQDRIGQLMANLIGNGLKYNQSKKPWVEVGTLTPEAGPWVTIYFRDNGIGIDPQFHSKIFQLFRRLHTRDEYEGTGAGLAICQKIVQAHGGRIWVESTPNQGATFFVSLNRCPREASPSTPSTQVTHAS